MERSDARDSKGDRREVESDRRIFVKRKTCWFCAKKIEPNWKDPSSYMWVVNEFGKLSPSRITGVCAKHQRSVTRSVKRVRCIGLLSYVSSQFIQ